MSKNDTKIRRVKAKDTTRTSVSKDKNTEAKPKMSKYAAKVAGVKSEKVKAPLPKWIQIILSPFIFVGKILLTILNPFLKIFSPIINYLKDSWQELKLVRWPTRAETWKMTGAVIAFSAAFTILILALDAFFNWGFTTLIGK